MSMLRIHLLGKFSVQRGDRAITIFEARKLQEFLCYLLLNRKRPISREALAGLFWGDSTTAQSKKNLRQALWQIQSAFNSQLRAGEEPLLDADNEWVQITPKEYLWVDCIELEKVYRQHFKKQTISSEAYATLRDAVELYQGDLLEGCYQDWCLFERERIQNMYLDLLGQLMVYSEAACDFEASLEYGRQILRYDWTHETTHRHLMRLYHLLGNRSAALRQYQRCQEILQKEYGAGPSNQTIQLYQQIKADQVEETHCASERKEDFIVQVANEGSHPPELVEALMQTLIVLGGLQVRIKEQASLIEEVIKTIAKT